MIFNIANMIFKKVPDIFNISASKFCRYNEISLCPLLERKKFYPAISSNIKEMQSPYLQWPL